MGPGVKARLSFEDNGLARIKAFGGNDNVFVCLECLDRSLLNGFIRLQDPNEKALRTALPRARRYRHNVLTRGHEQAYAHKFAGPQTLVFVGEFCLELNR